MRSRFAQFFAIFMLAAVFITPVLGNAIHRCDQENSPATTDLFNSLEPTGATLSESKQNDSQETPAAPHNEDCNCPSHHSGCHHGSAYVKSDLDFGLTIRLETNKFSDANSFIKPSPFLDGPFQPPRA